MLLDFNVNLHTRLQPCHMIMLRAEQGFQRRNCNKAQRRSFPSAMAFKTCWSLPLRYYRDGKSNCSVQHHFSWIFKSFNAQWHRPSPEHHSIDYSFSMWKFTGHFGGLFTYIPLWHRRGHKDHIRFIGITPGQVFSQWQINHLSHIVNVEVCMS